jgi:hypothetical protein
LETPRGAIIIYCDITILDLSMIQINHMQGDSDNRIFKAVFLVKSA